MLTAPTSDSKKDALDDPQQEELSIKSKDSVLNAQAAPQSTFAGMMRSSKPEAENLQLLPAEIAPPQREEADRWEFVTSPTSYFSLPDNATEGEYRHALNKISEIIPFVGPLGDLSHLMPGNTPKGATAKKAYFNLKSYLEDRTALLSDSTKEWLGLLEQSNGEYSEELYQYARKRLPLPQRLLKKLRKIGANAQTELDLASEGFWKGEDPETIEFLADIRNRLDGLPAQITQGDGDIDAPVTVPGIGHGYEALQWPIFNIRTSKDAVRAGIITEDEAKRLDDYADRKRYEINQNIKKAQVDAYDSIVHQRLGLLAWEKMQPLFTDKMNLLVEYIMADLPEKADEFNAIFSMLEPAEQEMVASVASALRNTPGKRLVMDTASETMRMAMRIPADAAKWLSWNVLGLWEDDDAIQRARETEAKLNELWAPKVSEYGYIGRSVMGFFSTIPYMAYSAIPYAGFPIVALSGAQDFQNQIAREGGDVSSALSTFSSITAGIAWAAIERAQLNILKKSITNLEIRSQASNLFFGIMNSAKREGRLAALQSIKFLTPIMFENHMSEWGQEVIQRGIEEFYVAWGIDKRYVERVLPGMVEEAIETFLTMGMLSFGGLAAGAAVNSLRPKYDTQSMLEAVFIREQMKDSLKRRSEIMRKIRDGEGYDKSEFAEINRDLTRYKDTLSMFYETFNRSGTMSNAIETFVRMGMSPEVATRMAIVFDSEQRFIRSDESLTKAEKEAMLGHEFSAAEILSEAFPNANINQNENGDIEVEYEIDGKKAKDIYHLKDLALNIQSEERADGIVNAFNELEQRVKEQGHELDDEALRGLTKERWLNMAPEERAHYAEKYSLAIEGDYIYKGTELDDRTVIVPDSVTHGDVQSIRRVLGMVNMNKAAHPSASIHEFAHSFFRFAREFGLLSQQDVESLVREFGAPRAGVDELFNEENAAETIRNIAARRVAFTEKAKRQRRIWNMVRSALAKIDAINRLMRRNETIAQNIYNQIREGIWTGVPVASISRIEQEKRDAAKRDAESREKARIEQAKRDAAKREKEAEAAPESTISDTETAPTEIVDPVLEEMQKAGESAIVELHDRDLRTFKPKRGEWTASTPVGDMQARGKIIMIGLYDVMNSDNVAQYPEGWQNRDTEASQRAEQVAEATQPGKFNPQRQISVDADTNAGTPIAVLRNVNGKMTYVIIAGNSRYNMLKALDVKGRLEREYGRVARTYAKEDHGLQDTDIISKPILVRVLEEIWDNKENRWRAPNEEELVEFAQLSNKSSSQVQTKPYEAADNADTIKRSNLARLLQITPGGTIRYDFIRAFKNETSMANITDGSGNLTPYGQTVIDQALFAYIIGTSDQNRRVIRNLMDNTEKLPIKQQVASLIKSSAYIIAASNIDANMNLSEDIRTALIEYADAKSQGIPVEQAAAQGRLQSDLSEPTRAIMREMDTRTMSQIVDMFKEFADLVRTSHTDTQELLTEDGYAPPTKARLLEQAIINTRKEQNQDGSLLSVRDVSEATQLKAPAPEKESITASQQAQLEKQYGAMEYEIRQRLNRLPDSLREMTKLYQNADELEYLSRYDSMQQAGGQVADQSIALARPAVRLFNGEIAWHPLADNHAEAVKMWLESNGHTINDISANEYYGDGAIAPDGFYYENETVGDGINQIKKMQRQMAEEASIPARIHVKESIKAEYEQAEARADLDTAARIIGELAEESGAYYRHSTEDGFRPFYEIQGQEGRLTSDIRHLQEIQEEYQAGPTFDRDAKKYFIVPRMKAKSWAQYEGILEFNNYAMHGEALYGEVWAKLEPALAGILDSDTKYDLYNPDNPGTSVLGQPDARRKLADKYDAIRLFENGYESYIVLNQGILKPGSEFEYDAAGNLIGLESRFEQKKRNARKMLNDPQVREDIEATTIAKARAETDRYRHSIKATQPFASSENQAAASIAIQILAGKRSVGIEEATKAQYLFKAFSATTEELLTRAKALAHSRVAQTVSKFMENKNFAAARALMSAEAEAMTIKAIREGLQTGVREGTKAQAAMDKAELRVVRDAKAVANLHSIEEQNGIDLVSTFNDHLPEDFASKPKTKKTDEQKAKEREKKKQREQDKQLREKEIVGRELTEEEKKKLQEREEKIESLINAVKAIALQEKIQKEKARQEREQKKRQKKADSDADADVEAESDADVGEDDEEELGVGPIALELLERHKVDLSSATEMSIFLEYIIRDMIIEKSKGRLSEQSVWNDPEALEIYRKTIAIVLENFVRASVSSKNPAVSYIIKAINKISTLAKQKTIRDRASSIISTIQEHAIKQTRKQQIERIKKNIKSFVAKKQDKSELQEDITRKISLEQRMAAQYLIKVLDMSQKKVQKEISENRDIIQAREALYEESSKGEGRAIPVEKDLEYHRALMRLQILSQWSGLKDMLPAEISDASERISGWLQNSSEQLFRNWLELQEKIDALSNALIDGIVPENPEEASEKRGWIDRVLEDNLATVRQRLELLLRRQKNPQKRAAAMKAINEIMFQLSRGTELSRITLQKYRNDFQKAVMDSLGGRKKFDRFMKHLQDAIPQRIAQQVSRQGYNGVGNGNTMTYNQALALYMMLTQDSYKRNVEKHKRENHAELLESIFTADDMAVVHIMRELYESHRGDISEAVQQITGMPIWIPDPLYAPARMLMPRSGLGMKGDPSTWTPVPATLSQRIRNTRDFDESRTLTGLYYEAAETAANTIGYGYRGLLIRGVLGNKDVQSAAHRYLGKGSMNQLLQQLVHTMAGSRKAGAGETAKIMATVRELNAYASLAFNILTALKQTASGPVFMHMMPGGMREYAKAVASWDRGALQDILNSDGMKARYGGRGWSVEAAEILLDGRENKLARIMKLGMTVVEFGDFVPTLIVAPGIYEAKLKAYMESGEYNLEQAKERAMTETWEMVESTQQSSRTEIMPRFYREAGIGGEALRLMLQFGSAPILQLSHEAKFIIESRNGVPGARQNLLRSMIVNHIIVPTLIRMMQEWFQRVFLGRVPDEDPNLLYIVIDSIFAGALSKTLVVGTLAQSLSNILTGKRTLPYGGTIPSESLARIFHYGTLTVKDLIMLDTDNLARDAWRAIQGTAAPIRHAAEIYHNRISEEGRKARERKIKKKKAAKKK